MAKVRTRLGVVEYVYHQSTNDQPFQIEGRFSRPLQTNEQPYRRKITATKEWKPMECGWIVEAGMFFLSNEEGKCWQMIPTEQEQAMVNAKIVELASHPDDPNPFQILPGETFRGQPKDVRMLMYRCLHGTAECWVTIFPR